MVVWNSHIIIFLCENSYHAHFIRLFYLFSLSVHQLVSVSAIFSANRQQSSGLNEYRESFSAVGLNYSKPLRALCFTILHFVYTIPSHS
ncbi:hypothetical protein SAMN05216357_12515 [Porphyromonadaceae bacterium KH3CP3RA]|nr:hypothetical protein SAMN05216357_12515 [Porphyromonadaceae bacterium KH3CP3RA]